MDFDNIDLSQLAEDIAANMDTSVNYRPVNIDVANKAASMIIELL